MSSEVHYVMPYHHSMNSEYTPLRWKSPAIQPRSRSCFIYSSVLQTAVTDGFSCCLRPSIIIIRLRTNSYCVQTFGRFSRCHLFIHTAKSNVTNKSSRNRLEKKSLVTGLAADVPFAPFEYAIVAWRQLPRGCSARGTADVEPYREYCSRPPSFMYLYGFYKIYTK